MASGALSTTASYRAFCRSRSTFSRSVATVTSLTWMRQRGRSLATGLTIRLWIRRRPVRVRSGNSTPCSEEETTLETPASKASVTAVASRELDASGKISWIRRPRACAASIPEATAIQSFHARTRPSQSRTIRPASMTSNTSSNVSGSGRNMGVRRDLANGTLDEILQNFAHGFQRGEIHQQRNVAADVAFVHAKVDVEEQNNVFLFRRARHRQ